MTGHDEAHRLMIVNLCEKVMTVIRFVECNPGLGAKYKCMHDIYEDACFHVLERAGYGTEQVTGDAQAVKVACWRDVETGNWSLPLYEPEETHCEPYPGSEYLSGWEL